jgi:hypothetical protein
MHKEASEVTHCATQANRIAIWILLAAILSPWLLGGSVCDAAQTPAVRSRPKI